MQSHQMDLGILYWNETNNAIESWKIDSVFAVTRRQGASGKNQSNLKGTAWSSFTPAVSEWTFG